MIPAWKKYNIPRIHGFRGSIVLGFKYSEMAGGFNTSLSFIYYPIKKDIS
jgi:hypothetical protein